MNRLSAPSTICSLLFFNFRTITVIGFDTQAQTVFKTLLTQKLRIGTQDLRIAAVALSQGATLVTRNRQDFAAIPALKIEDWSLP
jgi:tRNA(fMet)-specific endonuclease VapC